MRRSSRSRSAVLATGAAALFVFTTGCGAAVTLGAIGAVFGTSGGSGHGGETATNQPPQIDAAAISGTTDGGTVNLDFNVSDAEGDPTAVEVRYSLDPNENSSAAFGHTATGTFTLPGSSAPLDATQLATAPGGGVAYVFVWNTTTDVGPQFDPAVRLQILLGGVVAFTVPTFPVDNTAVPAISQAAFGALPNGATVYTDAQNDVNGSQFLPVTLVVADSQSQPVTLSVVFGDGSGSFPPSNVAVGELFDQSGHLVPGSPTVPTAPGGIAYVFRWSSSANGITQEVPAQLRFTATSPTQRVSLPATTGTVQVENSSFSVVAATPAGVPSDKVAVSYSLLDTLGEPLDVTVRWSFQGGTLANATGVNELPSAGTTGVGSSPSGQSHVFIWNAIADIEKAVAPGTPPAGVVVLSFTATKAKTQVTSIASVTQPFHFDGRFVDTVFGEGVGAAENVTATTVPILGPGGIAATPATIFLGDTKADRVRAVTRSSGLIETFFGGGSATIDGSLGKSFALTALDDLALGPTALYVAGFAAGQSKVFRVDLASTVVTTLVAGRSAARPTGAFAPTAVAYDAATDTIYFADDNNYGPSGDPIVSPAAPAAPDPPNFVNAATCVQIFSVSASGGTPVALTGTGSVASLRKGNQDVAVALIGTVLQLATGGPTYPNTLFVVDGVFNDVRVINLDPAASILVGGSVVPAHHIMAILDKTTAASPGVTSLSTARFAGVAIEGPGQIDVSDEQNEVVYRLADDGSLTVVAGVTGDPGFSGDGGAATQAQLLTPTHLAPDPDASGTPLTTGFFVADVGNTRVRRVDDAGLGAQAQGTIVTIAGSFANIGDGGLAVASELDLPLGTAILPGAPPQLLIADSLHNRVRSVNTTTQTITTYAGNGSGSLAGDGGAAASAGVPFPGAMAVDSAGNLYVAEAATHVIRRIDAATHVVSTVLGKVGTTSSLPVADGTPADTAAIGSAVGLALVNDDVLVVADAVQRRIYGVALTAPATVCGVSLAATNEVFTLGGTGAGGPLAAPPPSNPPAPFGTPDPGTAPAAKLFNFFLPVSVAATSGASPTLYVVDEFLNEVFLIDSSGAIHEVAGAGFSNQYAQGSYDASHPVDATPENVTAQGAALLLPTSVLFDAGTSALFVVDTGNDEIHVVNTGSSGLSICGVGGNGFPLIQPGTITPVVGSGPTATGSLTGDGGPAIAAGVALAVPASLTPPQSLAFSSGTLFFADVDNNRVRTASASGTVDTYAGGAFLDGDGGPADFASLTVPTAIACASDGCYAVCDIGRIRIVDPTTTIVRTYVGTGLSTFFDGPLADAGIPYQSPIVKNVVLGDNNGPRQIAFAPGSTVSPVTSAVLALADTRSNTIRIANLSPVAFVLPPTGTPLVTVAPGTIATILGDTSSAHALGFLPDGGLVGTLMPAVGACDGIAFAPGLLVFTNGDTTAPGSSWSIRAINLTAGNVAAGAVVLAPGEVRTIATTSDQPRQLAVYSSGSEVSLFWCQDSSGNPSPVAFVMPLTTPLAATAGNPNPYGIATASLPVLPGAAAPIVTSPTVAGTNVLGNVSTARGVACDPTTGDLWVCDRSGGWYVLGLSRIGGIPYHIAIVGNPGFSGDGGLAQDAQADLPVASAVDPFGNVYLIDGDNFRIRRARRFP